MCALSLYISSRTYPEKQNHNQEMTEINHSRLNLTLDRLNKDAQSQK